MVARIREDRRFHDRYGVFPQVAIETIKETVISAGA
jgi:hypothetical protein